jgi:SPP1 family predicted phage head-tail adaptor
LKAGELNKKITFQRATYTYDSRNEKIPTWTDEPTSTHAAIITTGGREFYAAQKLNAETSAVIKIRYRSDLNTAMRIKYGNRIFHIISINDVDAKHIEMQIACKEVV